jgi:hypothetical protein
LAAAFAGGFLAQLLVNSAPSVAQAQTEDPLNTGAQGFMTKGLAEDLNKFGAAPVLVLPGQSQEFADGTGAFTTRYLNSYLIGTPDPGNPNAFRWYTVASVVRLDQQDQFPENTEDALQVVSKEFQL